MNGLLIAALIASVHPNRLWHRRGGYAVPACCLPCDAMSELLLVSDYSGCTDQNRPSVNAAGVCSYLRDRMSLSVRHYPLCACCSGGGARSKARLMWGCSRRHPERQLPADMPDEVQSQWREWTAHYRRPHGLGTRQSAVAVEAGCACHAVLWQLLQGKWRCRAHRSGSGFDAGHSAITRADSSCG